VYSDELLEPFNVSIGCGQKTCICPSVVKDNPNAPVHEWCSAKKQINGSAVHITAPFGFYLSWLVYRDLAAKHGESPRERGRNSP
jgi:hypothetical protein